MTPRLLTFIRLLREHGLHVSVAESLDALHSVSRVGLQDRDLFRLGLRTALVKSQQDFATFDALFERFFTMPRRRRRRRGQRPQEGSAGLSQHQPAQPSSQLNRPTLLPPPALPPAAGSVPRQSQVPPATTPPDLTQSSQALQELTALEQAWQQQLTARPRPGPAALHTGRDGAPQTRLDYDFPPDQLANMYRAVEQLAARLLTRRSLRYRRTRRGNVDLRQTVLQSLRNGCEVPFALARRRRHLRKLRLVVLCDVSGSVWQVSTFLLKLVHTLQAEFTSVRSLLFVNSIVEVTPLFRHMRFPEDLAALRQYPHLNLFGFSDFGRAFYQLYSDLLGDLTRDTIVLILGDARNNNFDPQAWTLGEVRQRCQRIIWLNPEPRRAWNTGDSVLAAYAPYCQPVLECWSLAHLAQAADVLLHG
jgi:uncharacterized protein with von Willebrand factor type A (vWA) domain